MHSSGMIRAKHPNTACLQIIENFWAKHQWEGMSSLSTSHRASKNGKLWRNKAASSGKLASQQKCTPFVESTLSMEFSCCSAWLFTSLITQSQQKHQLQSQHQSWLKDMKCQGGWSSAFCAFGTPSFMNTLQAILIVLTESHSSSKPSNSCGSWLLALLLQSVIF